MTVCGEFRLCSCKYHCLSGVIAGSPGQCVLQHMLLIMYLSVHAKGGWVCIVPALIILHVFYMFVVVCLLWCSPRLLLHSPDTSCTVRAMLNLLGGICCWCQPVAATGKRTGTFSSAMKESRHAAFQDACTWPDAVDALRAIAAGAVQKPEVPKEGPGQARFTHQRGLDPCWTPGARL